MFIPFTGSGLNRIFVLRGSAEQQREIDLEAFITVDRCSCDRWRFVLRKDDRVLGTDATAGATALTTIVRLFHEDVFDAIDAIDTEQTKVDALHAVGAALVRAARSGDE